MAKRSKPGMAGIQEWLSAKLDLNYSTWLSELELRLHGRRFGLGLVRVNAASPVTDAHEPGAVLQARHVKRGQLARATEKAGAASELCQTGECVRTGTMRCAKCADVILQFAVYGERVWE